MSVKTRTENLKVENLSIKSESCDGDNSNVLSDNGRLNFHVKREASSSSPSLKSASPIPNGLGHEQELPSSSTPPPSSMAPSPVVKAKSETPAPSTSTSHNGVGASAGTTKPGPQLIGHLPRAEAQALATFEQLGDNRYQYSTLGRSREALESMTCDCNFVPGSSSCLLCLFSSDIV